MADCLSGQLRHFVSKERNTCNVEVYLATQLLIRQRPLLTTMILPPPPPCRDTTPPLGLRFDAGTLLVTDSKSGKSLLRSDAVEEI